MADESTASRIAEHRAQKLYQGRAAYDFIKNGVFQTDGYAVTVAGHVIAECEDSEVADWISQQWNAASRAKPEPDGWVAVSERLPTEGEESRVPLWLGNLKYPHRPHVVYGYYEAGRWWSQWGELKGDEIPTLWYRLPLPVLPEGEKA